MPNSSIKRRKPMHMVHFNLNSQRATQHPLAPDPWSAFDFAPILSGGQRQLPENPNIAFDVCRQFDSACFFVSIRGEQYLMGGVAWGARDCLALLAFLSTFAAEHAVSSLTNGFPPPTSLPWMGTVGLPAFARLPRRFQADVLVGSRRLATAIIFHSLATN